MTGKRMLPPQSMDMRDIEEVLQGFGEQMAVLAERLAAAVVEVGERMAAEFAAMRKTIEASRNMTTGSEEDSGAGSD